MAKYYRGDTLPITASFDNYKFQVGDVVTAGILQRESEDEDYEVLAQQSITVPAQVDEVQLEFSREQMHDIYGTVIVEIRVVTAGDVEMTIQSKELDIRRDGLR